jgi:hypothetical protein
MKCTSRLFHYTDQNLLLLLNVSNFKNYTRHVKILLHGLSFNIEVTYRQKQISYNSLLL